MLTPTSLLTAEQAAIVAAGQQSQLIFATAGAGKSTTLAHVVMARILEGVAPGNILVLTHSNPGRKRLNDLLKFAGQLCGKPMPQAVTVNALGLRLFQRLVDHGWLPEGAQLVTAHEHTDLLRELMFESIAGANIGEEEEAFALNADNADTLLHLIDLIKARRDLARLDQEEGYGDDHWLAEQLGMEARVLAIYRQFERLRRQRGLITFADQIHEPLQCFVREADSRRLAFLGAEIIILDEINDLSRAQLQLVRLVAGPRAIVVAAGDESQCIQLEQGAEPRLMREEFGRLFPRVNIMPLSGSFRFGPKLAGAMRRFMARSSEPPLTACHSAITRETDIDRNYADDDSDEAKRVVRLLKREVGRDTRLNQCALLFRDRADSVAIEFALIEADLPYNLLGGKPLGERDEVCALLGLLALGNNRLQSMPRARRHVLLKATLDLILPGHDRVLGQDDLWRLCDFPAELVEFDVLGRHAQSIVEQAGTQSPIGRQAARLGEARDWLLRIRDDAPASMTLREALKQLGIEQQSRLRWLDREQLEERLRSFSKLIDWLERREWNVASALAGFEALNQRYYRQRRTDAVTLGTFAQAKGHEWKVVLLAALSSERLPIPYKRNWVDGRQHASNERRLFYVGATRAIERLVLISPNDPALKEANRRTQYTPPPAGHAASSYLYELQLRAAHEDGRG